MRRTLCKCLSGVQKLSQQNKTTTDNFFYIFAQAFFFVLCVTHSILKQFELNKKRTCSENTTFTLPFQCCCDLQNSTKVTKAVMEAKSLVKLIIIKTLNKSNSSLSFLWFWFFFVVLNSETCQFSLLNTWQTHKNKFSVILSTYNNKNHTKFTLQWIRIHPELQLQFQLLGIVVSF